MNQVIASFTTGPGDSGAPVFSDPPQSNQVALFGIFHGTLVDPPYYGVFSPMGGIINDLGSMDATTPPGGGGGGGGGGGVDENGKPVRC
ncbi:MAG TPA: hypothetical protein VJ957_03570 [Longimicrobiales bacterium]|nr:hypothetical protein [Longimicrobiales bacterium]